ncbi:AraC family transcriptional regulator [Flindersiella endophytica]
MNAEALGLLRDDVLLEWYRYPPGPPVVLPRHAHEEYQLNLSFNEPGGIRYRGAYHVVPAGQLSVVMPGETHEPRDPSERSTVSTHLTLYVRPSTFVAAARELSPSWSGLPAFGELALEDPLVVQRFATTHAALAGSATGLARDVQLLSLLADLVRRHAGVPVAGRIGQAHRAVRLAREYLHDNRSESVSLADLSAVSGLSPYRLTRLFRAALGVPPHSYQIQLRVEHAKRLLLSGRSVSAAGHEAGFYDLSHFTRHFRRHVGVPPGKYATRARTYIPRRGRDA